MKWRYLPQVDADIERTAIYLDDQQEGLAEKFLSDLQRSFDAVDAFPRGSVEVIPNVRRARLSRFPYNVFYHVDENSITVIAISHSARHQRVWKDRL